MESEIFLFVVVVLHTHTHNWKFTHTVGDSTATSSSSSVWNFILYIITATAGLAMNFSAHSMKNTRVLNYKQCDLHFYFSKYEQNMRCIYLSLLRSYFVWLSEPLQIATKYQIEISRFKTLHTSLKLYKMVWITRKKYLRIDMPSDEEGKTHTGTHTQSIYSWNVVLVLRL